MAATNTSTLQVFFAKPRRLGAYQIVTANDNPNRDPTAWMLLAKAAVPFWNGSSWVMENTWVEQRGQSVFLGSAPARPLCVLSAQCSQSEAPATAHWAPSHRLGSSKLYLQGG